MIRYNPEDGNRVGNPVSADAISRVVSRFASSGVDRCSCFVMISVTWRVALFIEFGLDWK